MGFFGWCRVWRFKKYGFRYRDGYWIGNRKRRIVYVVEEINEIQEYGMFLDIQKMGCGWVDDEGIMQDFELVFW